MSGEKIFQALGSISDEKLESAMYVYERKQKRRARWFRVAACAAMVAVLLSATFLPKTNDSANPNIIADPGIMRAYACELEPGDFEELKQYELTDSVNSNLPYWVEYSNSAGFGIPLQFTLPENYYPEGTVTFTLSADCGVFFERVFPDSNKLLGEQAQVSIGEVVYWDPKPSKEFKAELGNEQAQYLYIYLYVDGQIAGYGLIDVVYRKLDGGMVTCYIKQFRTVSFPCVDGQLQEIAEEYVNQQLDELKKD